jgi:uncharacterized protein (DUF952 family)
MARWLFHMVKVSEIRWDSSDRYAPESLHTEGFVHASFREAFEETARLYFKPDDKVRVLVIDPRKLDVPLQIADTPRGPMPHVHGSIPRHAVRDLTFLEALLLPPLEPMESSSSASDAG